MAFSIKNVFFKLFAVFFNFFAPHPNPKTPRGFAPGADFAESLKQVAPGAEVAPLFFKPRATPGN